MSDYFKKQITDLEFLILTVRLFRSFIQYGEKVFLKDFFLDKMGLIIETDADFKG